MDTCTESGRSLTNSMQPLPCLLYEEGSSGLDSVLTISMMAIRASLDSWKNLANTQGKRKATPIVFNMIVAWINKQGTTWDKWSSEDMTELRQKIMRIVAQIKTNPVEVNVKSSSNDLFKIFMPEAFITWLVNLKWECSRCTGRPKSGSRFPRTTRELSIWQGKNADKSCQAIVKRIVTQT